MGSWNPRKLRLNVSLPECLVCSPSVSLGPLNPLDTLVDPVVKSYD